jgi:hypothetical protein
MRRQRAGVVTSAATLTRRQATLNGRSDPNVPPPLGFSDYGTTVPSAYRGG